MAEQDDIFQAHIMTRGMPIFINDEPVFKNRDFVQLRNIYEYQDPRGDGYTVDSCDYVDCKLNKKIYHVLR